MKKILFAFALFGGFIFAACSNRQPNGAGTDTATTEINQLESASKAIEESVEELDSTLSELDAALDSLDILFPEGEQN